LAISGIGFVALFALISHYADKEAAWRSPRAADPLRGVNAKRPTTLRGWPVFLAIALLSSCAAFQWWHQTTPVPLSLDLATFPTTLGRWRCKGTSSSRSDSDLTIFDDNLSGDYLSSDGEQLSMRFGYLREQVAERKLGGYGMVSLLHGRGQGAESVHFDNGIRAKDFVLLDGDERYHVAYWYIVGERTVSEDYEVRLLTGARSFMFRASNGSLVVLRRKLRPHETLAASRPSMGDFADAFMRAISRYLPRGAGDGSPGA
jgi:EpsI family protein